MKPDSLTENNKAQLLSATPKELAQAFEAFSRSSAELIEYYAVLEKRIAELTSQLERSKRLAAIGEMSATLAHEIRNPLAGIELSASMLAKTVKKDSEKQMVSNILQGVKRLNGIISDILCFAQELRPNCRNIDIRTVIFSAIEVLEYKIEEKKVLLKLNLQPLQVSIDPSLMERVFVNLLENAIDASDDNNSIVEITIEKLRDKVEIIILDNGADIPEHLKEKIFEPFFTTKEKGTGLGLSISQRIIEAHKGTVEFYRAEDGKKGFRLCLPVS